MCDYFYTLVIVSLITKLGAKSNTAKYLDFQGHTLYIIIFFVLTIILSERWSGHSTYFQVGGDNPKVG